MAFTLAVQDNFTGSNGSINGRTPDTLGSVWGSAQGGGSATISSNILTFPSATNTWIINTTTLSNDQAASIEKSSGTYMAVLVRADASGNGYAVLGNSGVTDDLTIYKMTGGSFSSIASGSAGQGGAWSAGTLLRLEVIGSNLEVLVNGVSKLTVSDSTYTGGSSGAFGSSLGDTAADNFKAYTVVVAGSGYPAMRNFGRAPIGLSGVRVY